MREFEIERNPLDCGILYFRKNIQLNSGLTVLVGCNGYGKSTFIRQIHDRLKALKLPVVFYDNLRDGGSNARSRAGFYGDFEFLATSLCSSEGENILMNMGNVASQMGGLIKRNPDAKEYWFLLDAIDSGFSVDNIVDLKEDLFKFVISNNPNKDIYIVVAANEYEMCRGEQCFDTYLGKYIEFSDYEEYRKYILGTREKKNKRK